MRGDWLAILLLTVLFGLFAQAADMPIMLWVIKAIGSWFDAIPGPEEHFATLLGDLAWPSAILIIVYMLREPISKAASSLADRFARDDIEVPGFFRITGSTAPTTLKDTAVTETPGDPEAEDAKRIESLLEYAGDSDEKAKALILWIIGNMGPTLDPEEFLTEARFAEERMRAYSELIGGVQQQ